MEVIRQESQYVRQMGRSSSYNLWYQSRKRKFFVGTKSVFNVNPKINYTTGDIRKNHSGELANKLSIALRELAKLNISGILQGDFLFSKSDLKNDNIDGENMITFTPNTITMLCS